MPKGFDEPDVSVAKKEKLPPDVLEELRYAYDQYKNAEDLLDVSQLSNVLQILGYTPTEAELYDMIGAMDPEKSTFITYELFKEKIYDFNRRFYSEDEIQLVFRIFDQDRTGYVDFEELNRIQTNLGMTYTDSDIELMLASVDRDGDKKLTYEEFRRTLMKDDEEWHPPDAHART